MSAITANPAVCPYRTINYITHSLPQRCLPSSRSALPATAKTDAIPISDASSQPSLVLPTTDLATPHTTWAQTVPVGRSDTSTETFSRPTTSAIIPEEEADSESPLGKDNFLSFEEWRKRNLDKYGQSPDQVGKPKKHENLQHRQQPLNVLDSLGDEAEIDLDFSAFASEKPRIAVPSNKDASNADSGELTPGKGIPKAKSRSKDAGTTFKERFNYASFDCAATILKTNARSSGSSAVLVENKDSYMLNECSVNNKFVILELCEDILIDTLVLANFEFFSSIFRTFKVSVSDRYPVKPEKWQLLGTFEARNTREVQAFLVENPMIWTKFVQIEFLTHYGNEFYCPISLVRVHGTTMLEDYRHDEDPNKTEDREEEEEDDQAVNISEATETESPEAVADILVEDESSEIGTQQDNKLNSNESTLEEVKQTVNKTADSSHHEGHESTESESPYASQSTWNTTWSSFALQKCPANGDQVDHISTSSPTCRSEFVETPKTSRPKSSTRKVNDTVERVLPQSSPDALQSATVRRDPSKSVKEDLLDKSPTSKQSVLTSSSSLSTKITGASGSDISKPPASSTQPPPSSPTVQESFFKSVQKRLQMLESNSTLSLQYIEEQSRILRDAFSKVEQRQLSKTTNFLNYLNGTVLNELRDFRQQYDQLWQSTVIELETQREQSQRESLALNNRLGILADELVFQKRMAVLQSILVLICIGLVLFSRGTVNSYLDHPLLQNMLTRSATLKMSGSFLETPSLSPESTRPNSSHKIQTKAVDSILKGHRRNLSEDSQDGVDNPAISYSPPTPPSYDGQSELEDKEEEEARSESPSQTITDRQRSRSSPPVVHQIVDTQDTPTRRRGREGDQYQSVPSPIDGTHLTNDGSSQLVRD